MATPVIQRAFAAGELAPALNARADLQQYQQGLRTCRNFIVQKSGGVSNRPGFRFVNATKTTDANVRLVPYRSETDGESVLIEAGESYFRFYQNGALVRVTGVAAYSALTAYVPGDLVVDAGVNYYCLAASTAHAPPNVLYWYPLTTDIYEIPHPFTADGLFSFAQSGRVITFTHRDFAPQDLLYVSLTRWVLQAVETRPAADPPSGLALTPGGTGTRTYGYLVTAAAPDTFEESEASAALIRGSLAEPNVTAPNLLTWDPVIVGGRFCPQYYIYVDPFHNGAYGYLATVRDTRANPIDIYPEIAGATGWVGHKISAGAAVPTFAIVGRPGGTGLEVTIGPGTEVGAYFVSADKPLSPAVDLSQFPVTGGAGGTVASGDDDLMHVWMKVSSIAALPGVAMYLVSGPFTAGVLPGLGGPGVNDSYFLKPAATLFAAWTEYGFSPSLLKSNFSAAGPNPDWSDIRGIVLRFDVQSAVPVTFDISEWYLRQAEDTGTLICRDVGQAPDFALTPPNPRVLFDAVGDYPHVSAFHQQRRFFAQTRNAPDGVWASRIGVPSNFGISTPIQADDAIDFKVAGDGHQAVRHLVGVKDLILLTAAGEIRVTAGPGGGTLAPNALQTDQETYVGAAEVPPAVIGNSIVYLQARGAVVYDLRFDQAVEGLAGRDLTVLSGHLVKGHTIQSMAYQQTPDSIVWLCREDGVLLGLTYVREHQVVGWHRHDTGASGKFEQVAVVPEVGEDVVYAVVSRTIGGSTVRYIERLEHAPLATFPAAFNAEVFYVDAGLTYDGTPVSVVSGLDHLNGQVVAVVADGAVIYNGDPADTVKAALYTVAGGAITLPAAASRIHVGLRIANADVELLDLDLAGTDLRGRRKNLKSVKLLIEGSARGFSAGPDASYLLPMQVAPFDPTDAQFTGTVEMDLYSEFSDTGRLLIRQTEPMPLTILGVVPNVEVGG